MSHSSLFSKDKLDIKYLSSVNKNKWAYRPLILMTYLLILSCSWEEYSESSNEQICTNLIYLNNYIHNKRDYIDNSEILWRRTAKLSSYYCPSGITWADSRNIEANSEEIKDLIRDIILSSANSPPEYETSVFQCIGDYSRCSNHLRITMTDTAADLSCGVSYIACVVSNLVPFAGR